MIEHQFDFIGGHLGLDFANTVGGLPPDSPTQERLTSYARLVAWSQQAQLISANEAEVLVHQAAHAQGEAVALLERTWALREAIRSIFLAVAQGTPPTASDLEVLNSELERGMAGARVIMTPDGFDLAWPQSAGTLDQMVAPVARSAAMLLTSSDQRQLVRKCANQQCNWLFVDTTKNHSRRWCRTSGCGNMNRVRKFRERQRSQAESASDL